MKMPSIQFWLSIVFFCLSQTLSLQAQNLDPQIVLVPYAVSYADQDAKVPHPAHSNARITLKGILRNANCNSGYRVIWDINMNGLDTDDPSDVFYPTSGNVYDIGKTFSVPNFLVDKITAVDVSVINLCNQYKASDSFPLYVRSWTPNQDVRQWTDAQREIMVQMGIQEGLWYIHRHIARGGAGAGINGYMNTAGGWINESTMTAIWAMNVNGHLPAYPPNSINTYNFNITQDWVTKNNLRWQRDPYAETAMRLINYAIGNSSGYRNINVVDESNLCKIQNGVEMPCNRIAGTNDGRGVYIHGVTDNVYHHGLYTGSMSTVLPALAGTPIQVGALAGMSWEYTIQQMVDLLGYMQVDGGCGFGGWNYSAVDGENGCGSTYGSLSQWAYIGLESAEYAGKPYGVMIANRHKYRIPNHLNTNMGPQGGSSYTSADASGGASWARDNFQLTGGALLAARWTGMSKLNANDNQTKPFAPYTTMTSAKLRSLHDKMLGFISNHWNSTDYAWYSSGRLWTNGDYLCGNPIGVYNTGSNSHCGNLYGFYCHQKGYRTLASEQDSAQGTIGGQNWQKQFETYIIRSQYRNLGDYENFGLITDCPLGQSVLCYYGGNNLTAGVGVLILTPTIFNPKPVAVARKPKNVTVTEGCYDLNNPNNTNGYVDFRHDESFHPNPNARIELFQWDVADHPDLGSGRWWELLANNQNASKDFEVPYQFTDAQGNVRYGINETFRYRYMKRGNYVAELRVVESLPGPTANSPRVLGQSQSDSINVTVNAVPNEAPTVIHGGPYEIEVGDGLILNGATKDLNQSCGDTVTAGWELDADQSAFNDLSTAAGTIPASQLERFQINKAYTIRLKAKDSANLSTETATQMIIYPKNPIAIATAIPTSIACMQQVTFDGSASKHLNPRRSIVRYEWDVDGNPGFDGTGVSFNYAYSRYGTYPVKLRVTDDLGRWHEDTHLQINVNQGNTAPVARIAQREYLVLEGQNLALNASASYDLNRTCGDQIVRYEWDLNGNGVWSPLEGDITALDPRSSQSQLTLNWDEISAKLRWPTDRATMLPLNTILLKVTDTFGASATVSFNVVIFRADPVAIFDQTPDPAPIDEVTGRVQVTLDARESYSPIPGGSIIAYRWDLNQDGIFGDSTQPVVQFLRIYQNLDPLHLPTPTVQLEVTDHRGGKNIISKTIHYGLGDVPPTADADPSDAPEIGYHILQGDDLTLSAAQSIEPNKDDYIQFYRWYLNTDVDLIINQIQVPWSLEREDLDRDGSESISTITNQRLATLGISELGSYEILLEVQDSTLLRARDRSKLTIHPVHPVAVAVADPAQAACPQRVLLDGSSSYHSHPNIKIRQWLWDIDGNGAFTDPVDLSGEKVTYITNQYSFNGPMHITLKVIDDRGHEDQDSVILNINQSNSVPTIQIGGPYAFALSDTQITLNASASKDPDQQCGDQIVKYQWDLGNNGSVESENSIFVVSKQTLMTALGLAPQGVLGRYTGKITVIDRLNQSAQLIFNIDLVSGPKAVAQVSPNRVGCLAAVVFDGSASTTDGPIAQGFDLVKYEWDFDQNGTFEVEGKSITKNLIGDGRYTATLKVTDASGRTSTANVSYDIINQNLPPIANAGGPYTAGRFNNQWIGVNLDARASTDPNTPCDAITAYLWDTDDDGLFGRWDTNGANGLARDLEGALIQNYINPNWRVGLTKVVSVIACDDDLAQSCSTQPAQASITITDKSPPEIELLSPRVDQCVSTQISAIQARIRDNDGGLVIIQAIVDNQVVAQTQANAIAGGTWVNVSFNIDSAQFQQGSKPLTLKAVDTTSLQAFAGSGGNVIFDRLAPTVQISNQLLANVCYPVNQIPTYQITATDAVDLAPIITEETLSNTCEKTLLAKARDKCGNIGTAQRIYRVGIPINLSISGPNDGDLVANATFNWSLNVPPACINDISATMTREGTASFAYTANTLINTQGLYSFKLDVANCEGSVQTVRRSFRVNAPPIAMPLPEGHPNADPNADFNALMPTYIANEGDLLKLDGSTSLAPETQDRIIFYRWDLGQNGSIDVQSSMFTFDSTEDGLFLGQLEVEDQFGLKDSKAFEVLIRDVNPILNPGGPYQGTQGQPLSFNASQSRPANDADPLTKIRWDWGDQTQITEGAFSNLGTTTHIFDQNGQYEVRIQLSDEDSQVQQGLQVSIRDVNPVIDSVTYSPVPPVIAYELEDVRWQVIAHSNAQGDPIVSYDFDFLGNQNYQEYPQGDLIYQYENAGNYQVKIRVRDVDSSSIVTVPIQIREVTLSDLLREIDQRTQLSLSSADLSVRARNALAPADQSSVTEIVNQALWNQSQLLGLNDLRMSSFYQGNTFLLLDELLFRLNRAQNEGVELNALLWKISRQILRETDRFKDAILQAYPQMNQDDYLLRALSKLQVAHAQFENIDFKDRVSQRDGYLARDLFIILSDVHFALREVSEISNQYQDFPLPMSQDPSQVLFMANEVNVHIVEALEQVKRELNQYLQANQQSNVDYAQGVGDVLTEIEQIKQLMAQRVGLVCGSGDPNDPSCIFISDRDSLSLELLLMDLVAHLFSLSQKGIYVYNAQTMLTLAVKFRVEIDLIRVESVCGVYNPYPMAARAQQQIMLQLLSAGQNDAAMLFYISPERRCLVIEQFNQCVLPALNRRRALDAQEDPYPIPTTCEHIRFNQNPGLVASKITPPIPMRDAFLDIFLLYDIIRAFLQDWQIANPLILAQRFPNRTWPSMNRDYRDMNFDLNDVQYAIDQFNHDPIDADRDGLLGIVELECQLKNGVFLDPLNPRTQQRPDGEIDCDGDLIPNAQEIALVLNPTDAKDAMMDIDQDGVSNLLEWQWQKKGLALDIRDPSDVILDHDGDGVHSQREINHLFDPMNPQDGPADFDLDGLTNASELNNGLDPRNPNDADQDPDGDGLSSRLEISRHRNPLVADCVHDEVELLGRDDLSSNAKDLNFIQDFNVVNAPKVAHFTQGLICSSAAQNDEDWYHFNLTQDQERVAVRLQTTQAGLAIRLYDSQMVTLAQSDQGLGDESLFLSRGQLRAGSYYLKVYHTLGNQAPESAYELWTTILSATPPCFDDAYEGLNGNDQMGNAYAITQTNFKESALWLCEEERQRGDWFSFILSKDTTIAIRFNGTSDGQLALTALNSRFDFVESIGVNQNVQCINLKAGQAPDLIDFNISASSLFADGDQRVDYLLQMGETDLNQNPRGLCDLFNQGLYLNQNWPTLTLR